MKKPDTYIRSRNFILSQMLSFPTISNKDWQSCDFGNCTPQEGDLVSLQSAPASKWQISWYVKKERHEGWACDRYLLKSIEDHEECWWSNVGFSVYKPTNWKEGLPVQFRWSDRQYAFNDRWKRVFRDNDAYMVRPLNPDFKENNTVILSCYQRHDFEKEWSFKKTFDNWRKITIKMMDDLYKEANKNHEIFCQEKRKKRAE